MLSKHVNDSGTSTSSIRHGSCEENNIFLTFDDGPGPYTEKLLELLDLYGIKASFFVVGNYAAANPEVIKRMAASGHLIGLHSLEHRSAYLQTKKYGEMDFGQSVRILKELGVTPEYYRPPWGHLRSFSYKLADKYGLQMVGWDVMAEDWCRNATPSMIFTKLQLRTRPGNIVCLHDGRGRGGAPARTIEALGSAIPYWLDNGFTFQTVEVLYGK